MLAKFKNLKQYINHGVWGYFYEKEAYPVKRKILEITVSFSRNDIFIVRALIENAGWCSPKDIYMTRTEALQSSNYLGQFELQLKLCNDAICNCIDTIADKKKKLAEAEQTKERLLKRIADLKAKINQNAD